MIVCLNGEYVPEENARISVFDRGFLYGDGVFETLRVAAGVPFRWSDHMERFRAGAMALAIHLPRSDEDLLKLAKRLIEQNRLSEGVLRVALSRGVGQRGYSPRGADSPTLVLSLHPAPALDPDQPVQWRLQTAGFRVAARDPLTRLKSASKLLHVLARAEAEAGGADEALLVNTDGQVVEASSANLFWIQNDVIRTVPPSSGALPGVTRKIVQELCRSAGWTTGEGNVSPGELPGMEGVFLTSSVLGIVEAISLNGLPLNCSGRTQTLHQAYQKLVAQAVGVG